VLVTGANGFVGKAVCARLETGGFAVRKAVRSDSQGGIAVGDIGPLTGWRAALGGMDAVVHLAARVHMMRDMASDPLAEFRAVNTDGTLNLARQAAAASVRRFVYLSSVKVNGEGTSFRSPEGEGGSFHLGPCSQPLSHKEGRGAYSEMDVPAPQDAYAVSKWGAELGLMEIARETGMEVVILRPPLVYGPGVKANFLRLVEWVDRGVPLPLASVNNRRSLVYVGNLADAVTLCVSHPEAVGKTYLVSDGEDVSTAELIRRLASALGRPARLLGVSPWLLEAAASIVGKGAEAERLLGSLEIDCSKIRRELRWRPPYSMEQGLMDTAAWFRRRGSSAISPG
jgi:nucleoside-diphosphate-sugar epimerase